MGKNVAHINKYIQFCYGGSCKKKGAEKVIREIRAQLKSEGLYEQFHSMKTLCNGRCEDAPTLIVQPDNIWYKKMTVEKGQELIHKHLKNNQPLEEHILYRPGWNKVNSENERRPAPIPRFAWSNDPELGEIYAAAAEPWEQNLYPMIKDIFGKFYDAARVKFQQNTSFFDLNSPAHIDYKNTHVYLQNQVFSNYLVIGLIKQDTPEETKKARIKKVDIYYKPGNERGIRFQDKEGNTRLLVRDVSADHKLWNQFISIYLERNVNDILPLEKMAD